ncbi:hypothetical protein GM3709_947 [Geminocystis sp. NIES-3709]|nr:hypothetical protein GM3709_947 [Geminocystis sp. NIES-3709]
MPLAFRRQSLYLTKTGIAISNKDLLKNLFFHSMQFFPP